MLAQEAAEVYPTPSRRHHQRLVGVDYSKYVPLLIAELQALRKRVAELEAMTMMLGDQPQIRTLMREAADEALAAQVATLYKIYLSNPATTDKQRKATAQGLERAIEPTVCW